MKGHTARFTTVEFASMGRAEGGKPAPAVDYYDDFVPAFAVCAEEQDRAVAQSAIVPKAVWFEEPTEEGLKNTFFAIPIHFDYQNVGAPRAAKPVDQAILDA
eukprot:2393600-Rhodomonas_salina.1